MYNQELKVIRTLDTVNKESIDFLIDTLGEEKIKDEMYQKEFAKKISQLHKSEFDINGVEYLRNRTGISKEDPIVKKGVYLRGKNFMFKLNNDKEKEEDYFKEKAQLEELCNSYNVTQKVEEAKNKNVNKALLWYQKNSLKGDILSSSLAFTYGDFMAHLAQGKDYGLEDGLIMAGLGAFYAVEQRFRFKVINKYIKTDSTEKQKYKVSLKEWLNPLKLPKNISRKFNHNNRVIADEAYNLAIWLPRHFGILSLREGSKVGLDTFKTSTAVGIGQLPIVYPLGYIIQNKIPVQYRVLGVSAINVAWSTAATLIGTR